MSEITKLYENVGIKCLHPLGFCKHIGATCEVCERHKYPPFTAEKQLELIKWLMRERYLIEVIDTKKECFERSLAGLINDIWQFMTEDEHKQIREILE